jgi:hypothetical protein
MATIFRKKAIPKTTIKILSLVSRLIFPLPLSRALERNDVNIESNISIQFKIAIGCL